MSMSTKSACLLTGAFGAAKGECMSTTTVTVPQSYRVPLIATAAIVLGALLIGVVFDANIGLLMIVAGYLAWCCITLPLVLPQRGGYLLLSGGGVACVPKW